MKNIVLTLTISFLTITLFAQDKTVSHNDFKINGLSLIAKKNDIIRAFGNPQKIFEPKYECGFLSESEQGNKYYSLQYQHFKFTGNNKEGYLLEQIEFKSGLKGKVTFKNKELSNKTTIKEFETLFKVKITGTEKKLYFQGADDALIFTFANGRLAKIEEWSPC